ncbi:hypothetical protein DFJ77DRAFT_443928 [Powellomyces hirtus]|nr:hypothetical protein DFJ77DRAFT_443928 [Powellomyces hirtus]
MKDTTLPNCPPTSRSFSTVSSCDGGRIEVEAELLVDSAVDLLAASSEEPPSDMAQQEYEFSWLSEGTAENATCHDHGDGNDAQTLPDVACERWDTDIKGDASQARTDRQEASLPSPKFTSPREINGTPRKSRSQTSMALPKLFSPMKLLLTPRKNRQNTCMPSPKFFSPVKLTMTPIKNRETSDPTVPYQSIADIGAAIRQQYVAALYDENFDIVSFVDNTVPQIWEGVDSLAIGLGGAPSPSRRRFKAAQASLTENFLESIRDSTLLSIATIQQKYRAIPDFLATSDTEATRKDSDLLRDSLETATLQSWWRQRVDKMTAAEIGKETRVLKQECLRLKTLEGKLQLVLLLECLRVHTELEAPLPDLSAWFAKAEPIAKPTIVSKRKRRSTAATVIDDNVFKPPKKRKGDSKALPAAPTITDEPLSLDDAKRTKVDRKGLFVRAVEDLMDSICMWTVASCPEESDDPVLLTTFVEPVVMKYYNSFLPDLVQSLFVKVGGNPATQPPCPPSPFFKKHHRAAASSKQRGSGMAGAKRRNESSRKASDKAKCKPPKATETSAAPRKVTGSLQHLMNRQIYLPRTKSKDGKGKGIGDSLSKDLRLKRSASSISNSAHRQSSSQSSSQGVSQRSSQSMSQSIKTYSNSNNPFKNHNSHSTSDASKGPLRAKSMSAIDDDNPFLDGPKGENSKFSSGSQDFALLRRTTATMFSTFDRTTTTAAKEEANLFARSAASKNAPPSAPLAKQAPRRNRTPLVSSHDGSPSRRLQKESQRRGSTNMFTDADGRPGYQTCPPLLTAAGSSLQLIDPITLTPTKLRQNKPHSATTPRGKTRTASLTTPRKSLPKPVFPPPRAPGSPGSPSVISPHHKIRRRTTNNHNIITHSPRQSPFRPPPVPGTPSKKTSRTTVVAATPQKQVRPERGLSSSRRGEGGNTPGTPVATPGSCQRFQNMLMLDGLMDDAWNH